MLVFPRRPMTTGNTSSVGTNLTRSGRTVEPLLRGVSQDYEFLALRDLLGRVFVLFRRFQASRFGWPRRAKSGVWKHVVLEITKPLSDPGATIFRCIPAPSWRAGRPLCRRCRDSRQISVE